MPTFDDATIERLFGADDAENENAERFKQYFFYNGAYTSINSTLPLRILVGHKGVGKSALLKRAYLSDLDAKKHSAWLQSGDIDAIRRPLPPQASLVKRIESWKLGLYAYAAKRLLSIAFPENHQLVAADIESANNLELEQICTKVVSQLNDGTASGVDLTIYIDDIDRGWSAKSDDISDISALLNAMRDIAGANPQIKFRIGLRSDVYFLVRTSDESTDKIERNVVWLKWTNDEILRLAAKRIETFFGTNIDETTLKRLQQNQISQSVLSKVIDPVFRGRGHWDARPIHNVILSLTRARPRDLIKIFQGGAKIAHTRHHQIISSEDLNNSFERYSQERLQDTINEFKTELPQIENLLLHMRPTKKQRRTKESFQFSTDRLAAKLRDIMDHVPMNFTNNRYVTPRSLIQFLYKIDFITARLDKTDSIDRKYFEESRFLATDIVEFGYGWEIHPAYRWALQPQDIQSVIDSIDI